MGGMIDGESGPAFGFALGTVVGMLWATRARVKALEWQQQALERHLEELQASFERLKNAVRERPAAHEAQQPVPSAAERVAMAVAARKLDVADPPRPAGVAPAPPVQGPDASGQLVASAADGPEAARPASAPELASPPVGVEAERAASASGSVGPESAATPASPARRAPDAQLQPARAAVQDRVAAARAAAPPDPFAEPHDPLLAAVRFIRSLLFGGNTLVRVGILVLLVGAVLTLRWAAENSLFPLELRMAAVALGALGLVVVGYRQQRARPGFGRSLEGGGIAALYLVVFFSFRVYGLLTPQLAFALLVAIAIASGVLAVAQDAQALILIGQVGGFMAPLLASTGEGSHVALFSYYLLLDLLILALAWFKSWRALHLLGFAFTFGIASLWGVLRYRSELFASTEPFLLAFFAIYTAIAVIHALRRPQGRGDVLDATLVFGTPLSALLLQYALVKDTRFGMAFSALGLGVVYLILGRVLQRRAPAALRNLIEAFLALAIGFGTLAVPYGFDNHNLTGATWALEGAGLYWAGARQGRLLPRVAGVALQVLAYLALLTRQVDAAAAWPIANTRFLAGLLTALSSLFIAQHADACARRERGVRGQDEARALQPLIVPALIIWFEITSHELGRHVAQWWLPGSLVALIGASAWLLESAGRRLAWQTLRYPALLLTPVLLLALLIWETMLGTHPLGRAGALGFGVGAFAAIWVLRGLVEETPALQRPSHALLLWFAAALVGLEAMHLTRDFAQLNAEWAGAALGASVALVALGVLRASEREAAWPLGVYRSAYVRLGDGVLLALLVLWCVQGNLLARGDTPPLPYLPLLNPFDLAQCLFFLFALGYRRALWRQGHVGRAHELIGNLAILLSALAFFAFNAMLARSVHQFTGVPFEPDALWRSSPLQVAYSISWSLLGLIATVLASRRGLRVLWIIGASLLGVVVAKLFLVDLAALGTGIKIATFLVVGLLLVLVGYFAPVPPGSGRSTREEA